MIRHWIEKSWLQYLVLMIILGGAAVYWGFFFDFGYDFDWTVLYRTNETYGEILGLNLLTGLKLTVLITAISAVVALVLGTIIGLGRLSTFKPVYWVCTAYVEFFRNTPLLVQLFFWYFAMPMALPEAARNFVFSRSPVSYEFLSATAGLSIYTASFIAEIVRAGLQSIQRGLLEAAYSSGLTYFQVLRTIILPLAFRAIIPPLGSEFLSHMKNTSLAMVVGVGELTWQSQQIESLTFRGFEATTAATLIYLGLSLLMSSFNNAVNVRLRVGQTPERDLACRVGDVLFWPFEKIWAVCVHPVRWIFFQRKRLSLQYTSFQAALRLAWRAFLRSTSLLVRIAFAAGLVYLLYVSFRGLAALKWKVAWENLGTLLIWRFPSGDETELFWGLGGLSFSVLMALIAIGVSFWIGLAMGLGRQSSIRFIKIPAILYIEIIRGTPLLMVIFWVYFFLPIFIKTYLNVFWSATIALTLFTGAYLAEIVRGGIQNIPRGQFEAAKSTGLNYWQTMRHIILPQALKQMIPAIVGQFIAIFKDTSLAFVIGVLELTFVAQMINNRLMVYPFETYTTVAVLYFICCYSMSLVARRLEIRLSHEKVLLNL